jgi:hypothetical protein
MNSKLGNERGITLLVVLMVMVIMLSVVGAGLLFSGVNTKITANYQTGTKAFYAADVGVSAALTQLTLDTNTATAAFSGTMGTATGLAYRSGRRNDPGPQPLQLLRTRTQPGYSLGSGSGSNSAGYSFYEYQVNVTGTYTAANGTELAGREIEAIATYGPVPR